MIRGRVLITGISGMLGRKIAEFLLNAEEFKKDSIRVLGISRDTTKIQETFWNISSGLELLNGDVTDVSFMKQIDDVEVIFHCAAITDSKQMITNPVEVSNGIVQGTRNVLELARRCHAKSMVYLSSMEVYGIVEDLGRTRTEEELGYINLTSARSCYPMAKRMAEHYCYLYWKEYGVPVKVARLAQTFGAGINSNDKRVYMQFAKAVIEKKDIVLKTTGSSIGNYCSTDDAIDALLLLADKGVNGEVYNIVNEQNTMTIRKMAEFVATSFAEGDIRVVTDKEDNINTGYAADTKLRMNSNKIRKLGWKPSKNLLEMYTDVINEMTAFNK